MRTSIWLIACSLAACSTESSQPSSLRVLIHDAPADVDEVWVEFDGITAHRSGGDWVAVSSGTQAVDLLALQDGVYADLGLGVLEPGHYDQVRLGVTRAWVVVDGASHALEIPSGEESGVKIGHGFDVLACGTTTLSLDWDLGAHLHQNDNGYILRPTLFVDAVTTEGCGPKLVERSQELRTAWTIGVWDYYGDVAAHAWTYAGYEPFDPAWGTLRKVRVDQTLDVTFDLTDSVPGETFSYRMVFAGGGLWVGDAWAITSASEHKTYTWSQDPAGSWANIEWGYYLETYAKTTPHTINNTSQLTYIYEE